MSTTTTLTPVTTTTRVSSIDMLRGLVMVIMALDHTREFLHVNGFYYDATNLSTTTPILFFTRWITHFCAPTFVFLAGTAAYLSGQKKTPQQLSFFLLTRGLWLMVLEVTLINFSFWFDLTFSTLFLQVIWAIGISMLVLSALVFLPVNVLLWIGLAIVVGHNALDSISFAPGTAASIGWSLLHQQNFVPLTPHLTIGILYPVLPWIGVMTVGYCFGQLYAPSFDPTRRRKLLLGLGLAAIAVFVLLRATNLYGDPRPWSVQKDTLFTVMSFLNTTKYPPSLLFLLMTVGPGMLLLYLMEVKPWPGWRFFRVYGRVPLFYYLLHFYVIHGLAVISLLLAGIPWSAINFQKNLAGIPQGQGLPLGMVYLCWIGVVLLFYPLCQAYYRFRSRQQNKMWSYL